MKKRRNELECAVSGMHAYPRRLFLLYTFYITTVIFHFRNKNITLTRRLLYNTQTLSIFMRYIVQFYIINVIFVKKVNPIDF